MSRHHFRSSLWCTAIGDDNYPTLGPSAGRVLALQFGFSNIEGFVVREQLGSWLLARDVRVPTVREYHRYESAVVGRSVCYVFLHRNLFCRRILSIRVTTMAAAGFYYHMVGITNFERELSSM